METLRKLLKELDDKSVSSIYLREIALLMEEIELLKDKVRDREKEVKNLMKVVGDKNAE
tara:strand:- start:475 stop:651 length:177 start_codon:yes stop_codon:yes gene_type:complete